MRTWILALTAAALVGGAAFAGKYNKVISVGDKAPNFSGIPAVTGDKQSTLELKDIKDDVVVLVFLANHCPVVTNSEDRLIEFAKAYEKKGVKVIGICVERRPEDKLPAIKDRVKEKGYTFVYGYDDSQAIGKAYGATNTPQVYVLDKDRTIRYTGAFDDSPNSEAKVSKTYCKDAVDALLKGESVPVEETRAVGCGISYGSK